MKIKFKKLYPEAIVPARSSPTDAGYDLCAPYPMVLDPLTRVLIPTGICLEIPQGYYGRIAPRSGLALKSGIDVLGGVVDSGYRGEIGVILINLNLPDLMQKMSKPTQEHYLLFGSKSRLNIRKGDRIAQIIIEKCFEIEFEESDSLSETERADGGYGSSGR